MVIGFVFILAATFSASTLFGQETQASSEAVSDSRIVELEARLKLLESTEVDPAAAPSTLQTQLRAALARINQLEQRISKLETQLVANTKSPSDSDDKPKEKEEAADALAMNSSGKGELYNHFSKNPVDAEVQVLERDGKKAVLRVKRTGNGETFRITCSTNGGAVRITAVEQTQPPAGAPAFIISALEAGSGVIRNGVLDLTWTIRGSSPPAGANNRSWTVTVRNIKLN